MNICIGMYMQWSGGARKQTNSLNKGGLDCAHVIMGRFVGVFDPFRFIAEVLCDSRGRQCFLSGFSS